MQRYRVLQFKEKVSGLNGLPGASVKMGNESKSENAWNSVA